MLYGLLNHLRAGSGSRSRRWWLPPWPPAGRLFSVKLQA